MNDTVVVNLFAGPGTGKSTNAALVFGKLKSKGINAELVHEYAKDLVWEERHQALKFQPYIITKQLYHVHRVMGKVDIVITDSPILLGNIYRGDGYTSHLGRHLLQVFNSWDTLNIFLKRDNKAHPYKKSGRTQTEDEAIKIDNKILNFLRRHSIPYHLVKVQDGDGTANDICNLIDSHSMPN